MVVAKALNDNEVLQIALVGASKFHHLNSGRYIPKSTSKQCQISSNSVATLEKIIIIEYSNYRRRKRILLMREKNLVVRW